MSTSYETLGRVAQKRRTRQALIDAARVLVTEGAAPTVEQAAQLAGVSRATAYRYFPDQRSLLVAAHPETALQTLLPDDPPADAARRLAIVSEAFVRLIRDTEAQQRTMLRLSLEPHDPDALPLRQGRAVGWIGEALAPLEGTLTPGQVQQLVRAVRATVGIEALVWLTDVGGLSRSEAGELMQWSARTLLRGALSAEAPPVP